MQAGFSRVDITPPLGTPLMGIGETTRRPAEKIHDPIYVRALWVSHEGKDALIFSLDFCFIGRDETDRFRGVLGREFDLLPHQIVMNATHNHAGPAMGVYFDLEYGPPQRDYARRVEASLVKAAREARDRRREVRIQAGMAHSRLPLNRRGLRNGIIDNAPNPDGPILDSLPLCLLEGTDGKPVALLFASSTHPVAMRGTEISADHPGVAADLLDAHLGATCSMFLQGCGGDSRPRVLGEGRQTWKWDSTWEDAKRIGENLAQEVIAGLGSVLKPVKRRVATALVETHWPLQNNLKLKDYQAMFAGMDAAKPSHQGRWAQRFARLCELGEIQDTVPIQMQGIQLGEGLRIIAVEGELVAAHGAAIEKYFGSGVTFALGYSNGEGMYMPTTPMIDEGGYEVISYWEYGQPSCMAKGMETARDGGLDELRRRGIA